MPRFRIPISNTSMNNVGEHPEDGHDQDQNTTPENVAAGTEPEECAAAATASSSEQVVGGPVRHAEDAGVDV